MATFIGGDIFHVVATSVGGEMHVIQNKYREFWKHKIES